MTLLSFLLDLLHWQSHRFQSRLQSVCNPSSCYGDGLCDKTLHCVRLWDSHQGLAVICIHMTPSGIVLLATSYRIIVQWGHMHVTEGVLLWQMYIMPLLAKTWKLLPAHVSLTEHQF